MLDIAKMEFVDKPSERPDGVLIRGRLQIQSEFIVDRNEIVPMDVIKERMRDHVWRQAYHDLIGPIMSLQQLARTYAPYERQEEVEAFCKNINSLLNSKNQRKPQ